MSHAQQSAAAREQTYAYQLEGQILEVCDCNTLCPCWIGEEPDGGTCDGFLAFQIDSGQIEGVNVSGLTVAMVSHLPGSVFQGNWTVLLVIDDKADDSAYQALLKAFTGKLGGPLADVSSLVGERVGVERASIRFDVEEGSGQIRIGEFAAADIEPIQGATGQTTLLSETAFSTIPGAPAYVSKSRSYTRNTRQYGMRDIDLQGRNAMQTSFFYTA